VFAFLHTFQQVPKFCCAGRLFHAQIASFAGIVCEIVKLSDWFGIADFDLPWLRKPAGTSTLDELPVPLTDGPRDAEVLAELLGNGLTTTDLMRIPKYHGYLRMLIAGAPHTFSMTTIAGRFHRSSSSDFKTRPGLSLVKVNSLNQIARSL